MSIEIRPFISIGGWWTSYSDYYRFAYAAHGEFLLCNEKILAEENRISEEQGVINFIRASVGIKISNLIFIALLMVLQASLRFMKYTEAVHQIAMLSQVMF